MSNEVERAFAALAEDTAQVRLALARDLRRRADRRRRAVGVAAGAAAAVLMIAGGAYGARTFLAGPDVPVPIPAPGADRLGASPSVVPSSSPSAGPPAAPSRGVPSSAPPIPKSIPSRAFLQAGDMPGKVRGAPERTTDWARPELCGADYRNADRIGVEARQVIYFTESDAPADSTPKAAAYEEIMVFRGDGAESFMDDLRAAIEACPSDGDDTFSLRGSIGSGDESFLFEKIGPARGDDGEPTGDGTLHHLYWAAVRVGDSVAFVSNIGWESVSADRDDTLHLGRRAGARLAAWR